MSELPEPEVVYVFTYELGDHPMIARDQANQNRPIEVHRVVVKVSAPEEPGGNPWTDVTCFGYLRTQAGKRVANSTYGYRFPPFAKREPYETDALVRYLALIAGQA